MSYFPAEGLRALVAEAFDADEILDFRPAF